MVANNILLAPPGNPPRQLREAAGLSQLKMAARADVALMTLRIYEANREAVSATVRPRLDRAYRDIYDKLRHGDSPHTAR